MGSINAIGSAAEISAAEDYFVGSARLEELAARYARAAPRYTSYPTAAEFSADISPADWQDELAVFFGRSPGERLSIYVHIPFCSSLCWFCACTKVISRSREITAPYLDALREEFRLYRRVLAKPPAVAQLHWGGGTPNFLSPEHSEYLFDLCRSAFPELAADADISVEVDPRTLTSEHLRVYRRLGFNRISMGVQDFTEEVQAAINRAQSFAVTERAVLDARELGFSGVNLDLVYGLPNQTPASFASTLEQVLALRPDRIALYGYAHVSWKQKVQRALERHQLPDAAERLRLFVLAADRLCEAGYRRIGLDHFALAGDALTEAQRRGTLRRNFMGHTTHDAAGVLGLGMSSISSLPNMMVQNAAALSEYQECIEEGTLAVTRGLRRSFEDRMRGDAIELLLCSGRLDIPAFEEKWGVVFAEHFSDSLAALAPLIEDGLVAVSSDALVLSRTGGLFARNAAAAFDTYSDARLARGRPAFSQSV